MGGPCLDHSCDQKLSSGPMSDGLRGQRLAPHSPLKQARARRGLRVSAGAPVLLGVGKHGLDFRHVKLLRGDVAAVSAHASPRPPPRRRQLCACPSTCVHIPLNQARRKRCCTPRHGPPAHDSERRSVLRIDSCARQGGIACVARLVRTGAGVRRGLAGGVARGPEAVQREELPRLRREARRGRRAGRRLMVYTRPCVRAQTCGR